MPEQRLAADLAALERLKTPLPEDSTGFLTLATVTTLKRPVFKMWISWLGFGVMALGLVMAAIPLLLNQSSVLYTFYPPLQAPWYYYLGLTLFVVGSWISGWSIILTVIAWRREHKGETVPFMAFGSVITVVLWQICTLGIASEILALILPWTLGLVPGIDVQLSRTLFWFTGHPLVYFWLLPAYVSWYGMVPKQAGGKLFSEPLARFSFWLFLLLSTPLGLHHQYVDPGLTEGAKFLTAVFDIVPLEGDLASEAPKSDPRYYFRPYKTVLVRTVADGGTSFYVQGDHRQTVSYLRRAAITE